VNLVRGIAIAFALFVCAPAHAQEQDDPRARAAELYRQARALDEEGRTEEALPIAEEAYRVYPSAGTRYALALLHERLSHHELATRHYRMALAEPVGIDADLEASIRAGLERLGSTPEPLTPEPLTPLDPAPSIDEPPPAVPEVSFPTEEELASDLSDPATIEPVVPSRVATGVRLRASILADVVRIDRAWGLALAAAIAFDHGFYAELWAIGPHLGIAIEGGIEIGDEIARPIVALFVGFSPMRAFEGSDVALFAGPRVGLALHPFDDPAISLAADAALSVDLGRAGEGFVFSVPVSIGARWIP
jgi:hypothetical protein